MTGANMGAAENIRRELDVYFDQDKKAFAKLQGKGEPYTFVKWAADDDRRLCLYYSFPKREKEGDNTKRVPLDELVEALRGCFKAGVLTRKAFQNLCPTAASAGACGFAVTGRCLELVGVARYAGKGKGFVLTDKARASNLLK